MVQFQNKIQFFIVHKGYVKVIPFWCKNSKMSKSPATLNLIQIMEVQNISTFKGRRIIGLYIKHLVCPRPASVVSNI